MQLEQFLFLSLIAFGFNLHAQNEAELLFTLPFYFEDSEGNKDTVYIGGATNVDSALNPELGEINIVDTPFDSVFEVRIVRHQEFYDDSFRPTILLKTIAIEAEISITGSDTTYVFPGFINDPFFVVQLRHPPLKVSWDPELFRLGGKLNSLGGSVITNSIALETFEFWWEGNGPGNIDHACLNDVGQKTFAQFFINMDSTLIDPTFHSKVFIDNVIGSTEEQTLPVYPLFWQVDNNVPCPTVISSTAQNTFHEENPDVLLFPNPVEENLFLEVSSRTTAMQSIKVHSLTGQLMYQNNGDFTRPISVTN